MGRTFGGSAPFFGEGELGPHLTRRRLGRGLYFPTKWHLDPFSRLATTDMARKLGRAGSLWGGGAGLGPM